MSYRKIGDLIRLVDVRNKDLNITHLVGLTINKKFIPSVANTIGTDMSNYKIIRKNQFACSTMQVRRDKKMPVALLKEFDVAIISQAYPVFEVIDENEILPEYLMLWFTRSEFDREACFHAVGGVRGSLEWEDFCNMELPVPSIEKQREIVAQYQAVENKIKVNEQICEKLEATAQTLYKQWFVDFEFPCLPSGYRPHGQVNQNLPIDEYITKIGSVCTYSRVGGLPVSDGKTWFVYLILCENDSVYKGITNDLYRRFYEHYMGEGAEWTKLNKPLKVIHWESFATKEEAAKREKDLKTGYGRTWISRQIEKAGGITQLKTSLPAPQTELRTAGKMVYNQELEKEIPEGWEVKSLNELTLDTLGGDWGKENIEGNYTSKVLCIRGTDIPSLKKADKNGMPIRYILSKNLLNRKLQEGNIVIEISGGSPVQSTGRSLLLDKNIINFVKDDIICSNFCRIITITKDFEIVYNYELQRNYDSGLFFTYENSSNGVKNLALNDLLIDLKIAFNKAYVNRINDIILKIRNHNFTIANQNYYLIQLQSLLLSRLATLEG